MEILEIVTRPKASHTVLVTFKKNTYYMYVEVTENKIEEVEPTTLSKEDFEKLSIIEKANLRNYIAEYIEEKNKNLRFEMLEQIFVKTGGRPENPEIARICAMIVQNPKELKNL